MDRPLKLSEYMIASPARRRSILVDQKRPRDFITSIYRNAYTAIKDCICRPDDPHVLGKHRSRLQRLARGSEHEAQNATLCLEALAAFEAFDDRIPLNGSVAVWAERSLPKITRSGVQISVQPDLVLSGPNYRGKPYIGAIKLCFSKTRVVENVEAAYTGAVLRQYMERFATNGEEIPRNFCFVVDVFAQRIHVAPQAHKQRLKEVQVACEEIAARWPGL